ncbi:MAG: DUF1844 domain-containing protein [Acidobacteriota bacterium]|nr:DUF1844 domain-containing protein [Acidobacteriota bacterium]
MSDQNRPFVVTDRRKFTMEGEPRQDVAPEPESAPEPAREPAREPTPEPTPQPAASGPQAVEPPAPLAPEPQAEPEPPTGPNPEQIEQVRAAYAATADRLETAIRAANPGADHPPAMDFVQLIQSFYMTALMQLGGTAMEGQQPQVDLMGARQSIDMLAVLEEKTRGNLTPDESRLVESALFELRMGFLEVTQALARSAAARNPGGAPAPGGRPTIVK